MYPMHPVVDSQILLTMKKAMQRIAYFQNSKFLHEISALNIGCVLESVKMGKSDFVLRIYIFGKMN